MGTRLTTFIAAYLCLNPNPFDVLPAFGQAAEVSESFE
jgi:hypothetical protein